MNHHVSCICAICAPASTAPSPTLKATPAADAGFDPAQLVELFASLDARGKALAWNLMECAKRLQGVRG